MVSTRRLMGRVRNKLVPKRPLKQEDLDQWSAWRKTGAGNRPDFLRLALPAERAARLVRRRVRFGTKIRLQQVGSVPETPKEEALLKQARAEIRSRWTNRLSSKGIESLLARARVLTQTAFLRKRLGGRDPTVYQVLAITALEHGLDSAQFRKKIYSMQYMETKYPDQKTWVGAVVPIRRVFCQKLPNGKPFLPSLEELLFNTKNKALDSRNILQGLGLPTVRRNFTNLNVACQLLECAGLIKKFPECSYRLSAVYSVWVHADHPNPPVDYPNPAMEILVALAQGSAMKGFGSLHRPKMVTSGKKKYRTGNPEAKRASQNIYRAATNLIKLGLLEKAGVSNWRYSLSDLGKRLMAEYLKTNSLPEKLRKVLLGEKESEN